VLPTVEGLWAVLCGGCCRTVAPAGVLEPPPTPMLEEGLDELIKPKEEYNNEDAGEAMFGE
jgi:hypothetical protein